MKSFVTIENQLCIICGKKIEKGLLLDRKMRNRFERETITGFAEDPCEECQKFIDDNKIALVEIDNEKSKDAFNENGRLNPTKVYRTGKISWFDKSAWSIIFDIEEPKQSFVFVEQGMEEIVSKKIDALREYYEKHN